MYQIETAQAVAELHFPLGLPGFDELKRFTLIERPEASPLLFLQSLDCPGLSFIAAPVLTIDPNYQLDISVDDLHELGFQRVTQLASPEVTCLAILTAPENGEPTANLLAPVVIDRASNRAVQAVRMDSRYSHRHRLVSMPTTTVPRC